MLREEAVWLGRQLEKLAPDALYPMCNLGSASTYFRTVEQPYIDTELFSRPRAMRHEVVHVDLEAAAGVDLVGDVLDESFMTRLSENNFKSVMCCNLLEHVVDRHAVARSVMSLVGPGGYIVVTVPNDYPYHEYPIDTMFRPNIRELADLFEGTEIVAGGIVSASCYKNDMRSDWRTVFWLAVRLCAPFYRPGRWAEAAKRAGYLWRGYRVACAILQRR